MGDSKIEAALSEMDAGKREAALVLLLNAWRATNAPAIADVIDVLSQDLTEHEPPIRTVGSTSARKAWYAIAEQERPASLGRLLEVLPEGNDRALRLQKITAMDRDPRITSFVLAWLKVPPIRARRGYFFILVVKLLEKTRDVRILERVTELTQKSSRSDTIRTVGMAAWKPLVAMTEELAKVKPKALSEADTKALAQIRELVSKAPPKLVASSDPKELFAKVYANPDDDEARAVLGDLLQQQGDPRGEFIALQLARHGTSKSRSSRERELEARWGRDWLGKIEPAILKGEVVFERGFLARCRYAGGSAGKSTIDCEEWSTVTHLDAANASKFVGGSHDLLQRAPAQRSMRHVTGLGKDDVANLVAGPALPWETLGMRIWYWRNYVTPLLEGPKKAFANVRSLVFDNASTGMISDAAAEDIAALLGKWPQVDSLDIEMPSKLIAKLASTPQAKRLARLIVRGEGSASYAIDFKAKDLRLAFGALRPEWCQAAAATVAALAQAKTIQRVSVTAEGRVKLDKDVLIRGRYEKMSMRPLRLALEAASLPFELAL